MLHPQTEEQKGRFQYNVQDMTKYMTFKTLKDPSLTSIVTQLSMTLCTSVLAHQLIILLQPKPSQKTYVSTNQKILNNFKALRRPSEHTFTIFSIKILIDHLQSYRQKKWSEYRKGAVTGLFGFLLSRPFDQIDVARDQILKNQKKKLTRGEGLRVVLRHDGFLGLYKNQNLLGPLSASVYRSVFFGMWDRLSKLSQKDNIFLQLLMNPLGASLSASISTIFIDKFRSFCLSINEERNRSIQKKYRKEAITLKNPSELLIEYVGSKEFRISKRDFQYVGISVLRNWLILSFFATGQYLSPFLMKNQ